MESINEATMLYVMAQDILGPRPTVLGSCGEGKASPKTYRTIRAGLSKVSDFLVELEEPPAIHYVDMRFVNAKWVVQMSASQDTRSAPAAFAAPRALELLDAIEAPAASFAAAASSGTPVTVRENKAGGATYWTSNGGVPMSTLRDGSSLESTGTSVGTSTKGAMPSANRRSADDGAATTGIPVGPAPAKGGGIPIGVPGGHPIVPVSEFHVADEVQDQQVTHHHAGDLRLFGVEPVDVVPRKDAVFCIPPNDELLAYWDRVEDRLYKIRNCMDIAGVRRRLELFAPEIDPACWSA